MSQVKDFPLFVHSKLSLRDYYVSAESAVPRVIRTDRTFVGRVPGSSWTVFMSNDSTYVPVSQARISPLASLDDANVSELGDVVCTPVVLDRGTHDGVRRILFGSGFEFWLHRVLFLDAVSFLSRGQLSQSLDRYILVDVDDVFVGHTGVRVNEDDVLVRQLCTG